jgi:2-polyprenyl-3-methyl-5-hydroxy-6-metoxy-1,4-benzoquinol methylase
MNIKEILSRTQEEVEALTGNLYYATKYRAAEQTYWADIPGWIAEDFSGVSGTKCLDVGCGYGTLALFCKKLLGCDVYLINRDRVHLGPKMISQNDFKISYTDVELNDFPFTEKFDIILLTAVLEHFNFNPLPTLQKVRNVLSDTGRFYLSVPNADSHWGKISAYFKSMDDMPMPKKELFIDGTHHYHYKEDELTSLLERAGFKILRKSCSYGIFNITTGV